jgi:hypothetical protein
MFWLSRAIFRRNTQLLLLLLLFSRSSGGNFPKIIVYSTWRWTARAETCSGEININKHLKTLLRGTVLPIKLKKLNSMVWVRVLTIPTERPPFVGEVISNFLRIEGATWSAWRILRPYSWFSRYEPLLFYQVAPQFYSRGWVDPVPDPLHFFCGSAGNRTGASVSVAKNSDH